MIGLKRCAAAVLLLSCVSALIAELPSYTEIQLQARSNIVDGFNLPALSSFNSKTPALNNERTIAFTLIVVGGGDAGLFVGQDGAGSVVYSAPTDRLLEDAAINSAGEVSFDQSDVFSDGIFVYDPESGQTTQAVAPITFNIATRAEITETSTIGYRASALGGPQSWRHFDGNTESFYAVETGGIAFLFTPSTNGSGKIAGKVRLGSTANSSPDEIRIYDGPGSFTVMAQDVDADPASPYAGFDNSVSLTDDDRVAFTASLVGGGRGVFLTDGTTDVTVATEADPDVSEIVFFGPIANNVGLVAFRGIDGAGLDAIFVGDGIDLLRVIGEHDLLETDLGTARIDQNDNSVVFGGALGLNDNGDLAFNAALTPEGNDQIEWGSGMFIAYANSPPPPVPDGNVIAGRQLKLRKQGSDLRVQWDAAECPAQEYNLFQGDLDAVATLAISDAVCSVGTTGVAVFAPPIGSTFLLLASENLIGVGSGHGFSSDGAPRSSTGVGFCGIVERSLEGACR